MLLMVTDDTCEMLPYEVQCSQDVIGPPVDLLNLSSQLWHKSLGYGRTLYIDYEAWVCYFLWVCSIVRMRFYYLPVLKKKAITGRIDKVESNWTRRKVSLKHTSVWNSQA